jgi:membrane protein DedA with SNARE-associated domain
MDVSTIIALFLQYKYPALVVLSLFEGPYVMMLSGLLLKLGVVALVPVFIALSIGDLIGDTLWYYVGYFFGDRVVLRFGKFFDITKENIENAKQLFSKHRKKILFGSKATAGFGFSLATLVAAGAARVPFWEYIYLNVIGQFIWTTLMLSVGYFFGNLYVVVDNVLGKVFIVGLAFLILYLLLRVGRRVGRQAKERLSDEREMR